VHSLLSNHRDRSLANRDHPDKRSRAALRQRVPGKAFSFVERWLSAYAVMDAKGAVITTGWRTRRILRD